MLPMQRIPFGDWLPDQPTYMNGGATLIRNAVPQAGSYRQLNALNAFTDALGEEVLGAVFGRDASGTVVVIAGTATRLVKLSGTSWSNLRTGLSVTGTWEFVVFGTDVIAIASGVNPQVTSLTGGATAFVDLATATAPRAKRVAVVRDFVVLGDLDSDSRVIQWSGFNNASIWDANGSAQYQADSQTLFEGGAVQKLVGGSTGYIFQEEAIRILENVGPPFVFSIQVIDKERGTPAPDSVVQAGDRVFFYANDGFFALQGTQFTPIGEERVNRWFRSECATTEIANMRGVVDRTNRLVYWHFSSVSGGAYDRALIYNYSIDKWSYAEIDIGFPVELRSIGFNLDTLATILTGGIDADSIPVDSDAYLGGALALRAFTSTGALGNYDGAALTATLDTTELDGGDNGRFSATGARPIVEGTSATSIQVALGGRNSLTANPTFTANRDLNPVGEAPILLDSRYMRARVTISGGFTHAAMVDVMGRRSGRF